jgi:dipeptidyl aminopeptidase/acylaminoacyl peptidase
VIIALCRNFKRTLCRRDLAIWLQRTLYLTHPAPLVVFPQGGPIGVCDGLGFDWWAQAFASRGYAVFQPNYRGSGGYSPEFRRAGYGEWGRRILSDIADGVIELGRRQIIDSRRI